MAFQQSPGVQVNEKDFSVSIKSPSTDVIGYVGDFEWGACFSNIFITNSKSFIQKFGNRTDLNTEHWFAAKNIFDYTQSALLVRAANENFRNAGLKILRNDQVDPGMVSFNALQYNDDPENFLTNTELDFQANERLAILAKYPGVPGNNISVAMASFNDFIPKPIPEPNVEHTLFNVYIDSDNKSTWKPNDGCYFVDSTGEKVGESNCTVFENQIGIGLDPDDYISIWIPTTDVEAIYKDDNNDGDNDIDIKGLINYHTGERLEVGVYKFKSRFIIIGDTATHLAEPSDNSLDDVTKSFSNNDAYINNHNLGSITAFGGSGIKVGDIEQGTNFYLQITNDKISFSVGDILKSGDVEVNDDDDNNNDIIVETIEIKKFYDTNNPIEMMPTFREEGYEPEYTKPVYETINDIDFYFEDEMEYPLEENEAIIFVWFNNDLLEKHIVSFNKEAKNVRGNSIYIEEVISRESAYIYVYENKTIESLPYQLSKTSLAGGARATLDNGDICKGYDLFKNREDVDVQFIIDGANCNAVVQQHIIDNVISKRMNSVGYFCFPRNLLVGVPDDSTRFDNCVEYVTKTLNRGSSSFGAIYANWKHQYDPISDKSFWVPCSTDVAGVWAKKAANEDIFIAGMGYDEDVTIKNVSKFAWNPDLSFRNKLHGKYNINPIIFDNSQAIVLGLKTLLRKDSNFSDLDTRWLFILIADILRQRGKFIIGKKNTPALRRRYINSIAPIFRFITGRDGIDKWEIVCDETNNTDEVLAQKGFVADHYITPTVTGIKVQLNLYNVGHTFDIQEIIKQVQDG